MAAIKYHGGEIEVKSELSKGSTFTIILPDAALESEKPDGEEAQDEKN